MKVIITAIMGVGFLSLGYAFLQEAFGQQTANATMVVLAILLVLELLRALTHAR